MTDIIKKIQFLNSVVDRDYDNIVTHNKYVHILKDDLTGFVDRCVLTVLLSQIDDVTLNMFKNITTKSSDLMILSIMRQVKFLYGQVNKENYDNIHIEYVVTLLEELQGTLKYVDTVELDRETLDMITNILKKCHKLRFALIKNQIQQLHSQLDQTHFKVNELVLHYERMTILNDDLIRILNQRSARNLLMLENESLDMFHNITKKMISLRSEVWRHKPWRKILAKLRTIVK